MVEEFQKVASDKASVFVFITYFQGDSYGLALVYVDAECMPIEFDKLNIAARVTLVYG